MNKKTLLTVIVLGAVFIIMAVSGITTFGSSIRLGFIERSHADLWSAKYYLFTGFRERKINPGDTPHDLNIEIETSSGNIDLEIKGEDGTVFYSEQDIPSSSFVVTITGKVSARVTARRHRGGFSVKW